VLIVLSGLSHAPCPEVSNVLKTVSTARGHGPRKLFGCASAGSARGADRPDPREGVGHSDGLRMNMEGNLLWRVARECLPFAASTRLLCRTGPPWKYSCTLYFSGPPAARP
jgi:hypothetical protein